ncbi:MAG: MoxR family ATPase [Chloroflexota bacterium]|nr:MoxR family ATPase [Chloroflexota bacterium]MDE2940964.1 MoxR family ATPase [Chloroflexota bacterium]MDE3267026.1 MoxR family ATPase [Chloroflexota bacterium]
MNERELEEARLSCEQIIDRIGTAFVGNRVLLRKLLGAALANGHVLFEDFPGLGKTLLAKVFAKSIGSDTKRVQFTPDLLPTDILGVNVWRQNDSTFQMVKGPVFTNVLLADEINRAPPKTQSALLEAMEERQVTIDGTTNQLSLPFVVIATQNPIEQEGTYPLPEAQLDRFLLKLSAGYPANQELENDILLRRIEWQKDDPTEDLEPAVDMERFVELQRLVETRVYTDPLIIDYITQLVRLTREHPRVAVGVSPRGALALLRVSRGIALIHGRDFVVPDDVKMVVSDALSHRVILNIEDTLEGVRGQEVIDEVLQEVPVPSDIGKSGS